MKGVQIDPSSPEKSTFKKPIRVNDLFINYLFIKKRSWRRSLIRTQLYCKKESHEKHQ